MRSVTVVGAVGVVLLAAGMAHAGTIGPDAFGYTATDTVRSAFEDISGTGTAILTGPSGDGTATTAIGFTFGFYGSSFTTVGASVNGLLTFGGTSGALANVDLGTTALTPNLASIAVFWTDLGLDNASQQVFAQTLGVAGSRRLIVQWQGAYHVGGPTGNGGTFQAVLFEGTNDIVLRYADMDFGNAVFDNGTEATVGIRDVSGHTNGRSLNWSFNQSVITNGTSILFSANPVPLPSAAWMGLISLGGLALFQRLRRRRSMLCQARFGG